MANARAEESGGGIARIRLENPTVNKLLSALLLSIAFFAGHTQAATVVSTFDDLSLAPDSHFFPEAPTTFTSGLASFKHEYFNDPAWGLDGCCHSGFVYANRTDTTTSGYLNQHSAVTGGGAAGSANYAIAYLSNPTVVTQLISFSTPSVVQSASFSNTTYAALSMRDGDGFVKKFGSESGGEAPDYFRLQITGFDAAGVATATVDFYLADYRFADNGLDYILTDWHQVDLTSLGAVSGLGFAVDSAVRNTNPLFGTNIPAYFALDNLAVAVVPEPEQIALMLAGLVMVVGAARRRLN